ncbi:hypothetical protein G7Y89_g15448 [Cudoniella acicularis]|uniref:Phosphatidic acid phosphatase type 2/haloperoxidase domain-containing protein n=1 Tax=Cudoniella acicularis TaxID=354080 RepID=A0A8H4VMM9_9HELO|nr:hypothetical protein G7Y89_g15448 [Cudoniella acicularis]
MKYSSILTILSGTLASAAYPGDIVQYWVDQSAILVNGTVIGGLQSPPSGWFEAIVQGAVYLSADQSHNESLAFQQLAVSHAAHNTLIWAFHATQLYSTINSKLRAILPAIGLDPTSTSGLKAVEIGRQASRKVVTARADDGINNFVDYVQQPALPGVYQATPGGQPIPDTPQAQFIWPFAGIGDIKRFRAPPPPSVNSSEYEGFLNYVKAQGMRRSAVRTAHDTETAYFWKESQPIMSNRLATAIIGNSLATDVRASAKIYAQLNYALSNAAIATWDSKYFYNAWRPVTAIRHPTIFLASGTSVTNTTWEPLLIPTPNHQDYLSTHAAFAGAAAAVLRAYNNGSDVVDVTISSNVTLDNVGVVSRRVISLSEMAKDVGDSRVFGGIHFNFSCEQGVKTGDWVARETLKNFDEKWMDF